MSNTVAIPALVSKAPHESPRPSPHIFCLCSLHLYALMAAKSPTASPLALDSLLLAPCRL